MRSACARDCKNSEICRTGYLVRVAHSTPVSPTFVRSLMNVTIIGGGPAGLMAAEAASAAGARVELFEAMASVGRKFLLAGKGGLNLTHSEPSVTFLSRCGARRSMMTPLLESFGPEALRDLGPWARHRDICGLFRARVPHRSEGRALAASV